MRWATLKKNILTVFFVLLYFLINAGLFIWVVIQRKDEGGWIIVARAHGMCLNFNSAFILVLMLKRSLTWLRSTRIGKYFPIDYYIDFHKFVAVVILLQSILHFIGHLGRYSKYYNITKSSTCVTIGKNWRKDKFDAIKFIAIVQ